MAKKSNYLQEIERKRIDAINKAELATRQFMLDTAQVALHQLGWGFDRIKTFTEKWAEVHNYFYPCVDVRNPEADYLRARLDTAIEEIFRGKQEIIPFEERYRDLKKVGY